MKKKIVLSSIATVAVLSLVGCGGGSNTPETNVAPKVSKISGIADDDLILNGIVTAKTPSGAVLSEGRTSQTDGSYALNVVHTGIVLVNVTCEDGNSTMLNPATHATQACGSDVSLNSLADVEAGVDQTVHISPLTEIVYQRAQAQAGGNMSSVTATEFSDARNEIGVLFGVDPIADNPADGVSAQIIGAIHTLADEDNTSVVDVTNNLATQLSDGSADGAADETVNALTEVMTSANITNNLTDNNGTYTPPENIAPLGNKEAVQKFIQDLRTQGTTMESYAKNEAQDMGTALDGVALDINTVSDYIVGIIDLVSNARDTNETSAGGLIDVHFDGDYAQMNVAVTKVSVTEWKYDASIAEHTYKGTITIPEVSQGTEYTFGTLNATFNGALPYAANIYDQNNTIIETQNVSLDITLVKSGDVVNATLSDFTIENAGNKISIDSVKAEVSYSKPADLNENPIFNYVKLSEIKLSAVAGDYSVVGTLSVPEYTVNSSLAARGGVEEVVTTTASVNMYCTTYNGNSASISNAEATLNLDGTNYTYEELYTYSTGVSLEIDDIKGNYSLDEIRNMTHASATCSDGHQVNISVYAWNGTSDKIGNNGYIPKQLVFEGTFKNTQTSGEISGKVNIELINASTINLIDNANVNEDAQLKVNINGKLFMPQRPETLVNIAYETKADDAHKHSLTASYTHDSTLLSVKGSLDKVGKNGQFTFTNEAGVKADFFLKDDKLINGDAFHATGSLVTKDGKVIATIETRNDNLVIIKYLDGTFETIF